MKHDQFIESLISHASGNLYKREALSLDGGEAIEPLDQSQNQIDVAAQFRQLQQQELELERQLNMIKKKKAEILTGISARARHAIKSLA